MIVVSSLILFLYPAQFKQEGFFKNLKPLREVSTYQNTGLVISLSKPL